MLTLPSPAFVPLPDRISRVTVRVTRKVTRMARNIHIMGCRVKSARLTGSFTWPGTFTAGGIFTGPGSGIRSGGQVAGPTASTRTPSSCAYGLMPGLYAGNARSARPSPDRGADLGRLGFLAVDAVKDARGVLEGAAGVAPQGGGLDAQRAAAGVDDEEDAAAALPGGVVPHHR